MIVRLTGPVLLRGVTRAAGELVEVDRDLGRSLVERGLGELDVTPEPTAPLELAPAPAPLSDPLPPALVSEPEDEEPVEESPSAAAPRKRRRR